MSNSASESIPFDATESSEHLDGPHAYSLREDVPGSEFFSALDDSLQREGRWVTRGLRGTARYFLAGAEPGVAVRLRFAGAAVSLVRPTDFPVPGPYGSAMTGPLEWRLDGGGWSSVCCDAGREVLLAGDLGGGAHDLEVRCAGEAPAVWAVQGLRVWGSQPALVSGRIDGGSFLVDVRAEVSGPVEFTRSLRDGRTGRFSLLLPSGGEYEMKLTAPGWKPVSVSFEVRDGEHLELPGIDMELQGAAQVPARPLSADEPLVLAACGHCNTWGTEPAEWLARRVEWINAQRPHALLLANEVNPVYISGALAGLDCPWVITDGNHRQGNLADWPSSSHRELSIGPARILTAGMNTSDDMWAELLAGLTERDKLRVVCSYEPFAPPELLEKAGVRLFFYGHNLESPPYWNRGGTTFLRKVDADTFYRIEIGPPQDASAPIRITRTVFDRST